MGVPARYVMYCLSTAFTYTNYVTWSAALPPPPTHTSLTSALLHRTGTA